VSVRNVGNGIAVLHGWRLQTEPPQVNDQAPPLEEFQMQTRDMYIPPGDIGFWQGAVRDLDDPRYETARKVIEGRQEWVVDLLYGDEDGGQRVIGRFRCQLPPWASHREEEHQDPQESPVRMVTVARHWNLDRPDPRQADRPAP
jgi:hypothetical protein